MDNTIVKLSEDEREELDQIKSVDVTELVVGNPVFESRGYSMIKVTRNGKPFTLKIPIKSTGVSEAIDKMNRKAPLPPKTIQLVHPNSEIGKDLKLTRKKHVQIFDYTDEHYLEEKEQHDSDIGLKVVLMGIDVPLKDKDGNELKGDEEKLEALRSMGMTGMQLQKLFDDIRSLTSETEEDTTDFLTE